jgi:hypothetical protein
VDLINQTPAIPWPFEINEQFRYKCYWTQREIKERFK